MVLMGQQAIVLCAREASARGPPRALRPCRASHGDYVVTREIRQSAQKKAHSRTSVRSEEEGGGCWKSEAPIRAMRSGNAGGAKGCRFERTGKGDMARHRADEDHDHGTYSFYREIPHWGGFKLGAGWCNAPRPVLRGAGSNGWMVEIVRHRRETRRQQRRQISTCTTRRTRSTHQKLALSTYQDAWGIAPAYRRQG